MLAAVETILADIIGDSEKYRNISPTNTSTAIFQMEKVVIFDHWLSMTFFCMADYGIHVHLLSVYY